jgi:hypothetical protein
MLGDIPFDAEFHSLQNGTFYFEFRISEQSLDSYIVSNLLLSLRTPMSIYQSHSWIERLATQKGLTRIKIEPF